MVAIRLPRDFAGIIFDKDGVIFDTELIKAQAWKEALLEQEILNGDEWYRNVIGISGGDVPTKLSYDYNGKVDGELARRRKKEIYMDLASNGVPLIQSTIAFLESIPRDVFKVGLASSDSREAVDSQLNRHGLMKYFDATVAGDEVENGKPDPEIYYKIAGKLKINPRNCLAIEDTVTGMRAARGAGMYGIGFQNPNSGKQNLYWEADVVSSDLNDLVLVD